MSLSQPHVRPIVRGQAGRPVECGANISVSLVERISFVDRVNWDAYNEYLDLVEQIGAYHRRLGYDAAFVHGDHIYRTHEHPRYCASKRLRLSGPPLGRPRKVNEATADQVKHDQKQAMTMPPPKWRLKANLDRGHAGLGEVV